MAQKKGAGSTQNGRDSNPKMRGVKKYGGEVIKTGAIILRQAARVFTQEKMLEWVETCTLFALTDGKVEFSNYSRSKRIVSVLPA
ncbi:MAG: 50S ribosomal protein L27 [Bacteriovoracaceae bacterium]